jgi:hypothetical protein
MKAADILRLLKISRPTLYNYRKQGRITAHRLPNGYYDYDEDRVYALLNREIKRKTYRANSTAIIRMLGAFNILRKAFPEAVTTDGIEGLGLVPYAVTFAALEHLANPNPTLKVLPKVATADGVDGIDRKTGANGSLRDDYMKISEI